MRKTPYTNKELFEIIRDKVTLPKEILDYAIPAQEEIRIESYEWNVWNSLNFGTNEGIYLDIGAEFHHPSHRIVRFGTFKTLQTDLGAMREMGRLLADLVYTISDFVNNNLDDFEWSGYQVRGIKDGKLVPRAFSYPIIIEAMDKLKCDIDHYDAMQLYDRTCHRYEYYAKGSDGKLQKYDNIAACLAASGSFDPFDGHDVPIALKEIVSQIVNTWNIRGLCDGMYIANVIANDSGFGDGQSHFDMSAGASINNPGKIASWLQYAYGSNIPETDIPKLIEILSRGTEKEQSSERTQQKPGEEL